MSVVFVKQDLTTSDASYICHQVNCRGTMGSGVAKAIRDKWPIVYITYKEAYNKAMFDGKLLGNILAVNLADYEPNGPTVINMFAQECYGRDGKRYTSYDAFWSCLGGIRDIVPKGSKIAFPYKIGSCLGGANWDVIYTMIVAALGHDYNVEICYLKEDEWLKYNLNID